MSPSNAPLVRACDLLGQQSGYGRELGFEAMREYTQVKSVWVNVDAEIPPLYRR